MKRSTDTRKSPAEVRANMQNHYGELTDMVTDPKASKDFHRPAYQAGKLIETQGQQLWHGDVTGYIARTRLCSEQSLEIRHDDRE